MPAKDGWLVRLRPPGGILSSQQLQALAAASTTYGSGLVDLTGQGRLQVRGLSPETLPGFAASMVRAGLASADPDYEARRRITVLPGGDAELAAKLEAALIAAPIKFAEKFDVMVGIDDAPDADIMVHEGRVWIAGATRAARATDPIAAVVSLAAWLNGRRPRTLIDEIGPDAIYAASGLCPDATIPEHRPAATGIGVLFGCMTADILLAFAQLGVRHGNGVWHVTRRRSLILGDVRSPTGLADAAQQLGLIPSPSDKRRRVFACPGVVGCASAATDTRQDAQALFPFLPEGKVLHVSGCAKGCAHPAPADFTFVGGADGYGFVPNGRAADKASANGLQPRQMAAVCR
jgi:precorrin-3B synthase